MHQDLIIKTFKNYLETEEIRLTECTRFLGGMSNYTYHVVVNDVHYVIRIADDNGKKFVSYPVENLHLFLVEPFNITTKTLYYDTEKGIKISEYISGSDLTGAPLVESDFINVSNILHELHALKIEGVDFDAATRLESYEKTLSTPLSKEYFALKSFWLNELRTTYKDVEHVFCHGDAQRSNILKSASRFYLLDFEFAGLNDPYSDIASFGNISFNDPLLLLDYYLGRKAEPFEVRRLMFNRMYQVLQWHVVAKHKHDIGLSEKLHIDFAKYSANYLRFAGEFRENMLKLPLL